MQKLIAGKVRDVYEVDDKKLLIVTSDRISAFDVIMQKPVQDKGKILNAISKFWFDYTKEIIPNHIISTDIKDMPKQFQSAEFDGRTVLVKKLKMLPFECIVRGYMFGHLWEGYERDGQFCGYEFSRKYDLAEKLDTPIFTPSTKAAQGHDEYVSVDDFLREEGTKLGEKVRDISLKLYEICYDYAYKRGLIIADVKFEFGLDEDNNLVLGDELFTPDSSRFWSLEDYKVGISPKSYDKQFVRDWLQSNKKDGKMQFDKVPDDVLIKTSQIYRECLRIVTDDCKR